jgi:uncharacterized protein (TIGR01244 family)
MNELQVNRLSGDVCAAPQLEPSVMQSVADAGFKSVINNRPDFEGGPSQPTSAEIEAAALAAGLAYAYLPVHPSLHTAEQISQFATLLSTLPKPTLVFCRSGARSTKLFQAAQAISSAALRH